MTLANDWPEIQAIFNAALELPPSERTTFLDARCTDRPGVRAEIESLLASHAQADGFLDVPPIGENGALIGLRVGAFRLVGEIGRGGMSVVYLAERVEGEFNQQVAVKILDAPLRNAEALQRFRAERQILASFAHPNIVSLLDGGVTADGHAYLVMELVDGESLTRFCNERLLPLEERLALVQDLCAAVQYAHQYGVVHRDLKPANILVTSGGVVKVLDFGVAKLQDTTPGAPLNATIAGGLRPLTPNYASPEQVRGLSVTTATDIYALGVLTYEVVAGARPYDVSNETLDVILKTVTDVDPARPSVAATRAEGLPYDGHWLRGDLDAIVLKAMSKDPADRYGSAQQLAADLTRYASSEPVDARPPSVGYVLAKLARRHRAAFAAAAVSLVVLVAALSVALWQARRADRRFQDVRELAHSFLFEVYDALSAVPGTLGARRLVASRAQQYLDSLAAEAGNDSALERELAESYLRLGDVRGGPYAANLGDTAGALESYEKAHTLLEREQRRHPGDIAIQERLAHAAESVGRVFIRQKNAAAAIDALTRATGMLEAVCARSPDNLLYRSELSQAYAKLAEAQYVAAQQHDSIRELEQSLATSLKSLEILQSAGAHTDEFWLYGLASRHFRVGYALASLGDRTGDRSFHHRALEVELKGQAVMEQLAAAHPEHPRQRELADGLGTIGLSRWKCCQDLEGAGRDVRSALDIFQRLAAADPHNLEARRDVANANLWLGSLLAEAGQRDEALAVDYRTLAAYQELERADPDSRENADFMKTVRDRIAALERSR